jgi:tetratricopeptide (TPR) repeat protein
MRKMKDYESDEVIADLHLHARDYIARAGAEFEAVLKKDPDNADATRGLGYWYLQKGEWDKAEDYFQRAAKLGSTDARVHYLVAQALFRKGDRDAQTIYDMMQSLNLAIKYDRNLAEAYNLQGYVYANEHEYESAIEAIKTAIKINPRNEHFQLNLAQEYMAFEKYDNAIALFDKLRSSGDDSIAKPAEAQLATAKEMKDKPLMRLSQRPQMENTTKEIANSADSEELRAMEARQRGQDLTTTEKKEIKAAESKPDMRPMKYLTGKLLTVDCGQEPRAVLQVSQGQKTYKLVAQSSKEILVIGADEFSCLWKDRKISVNYRESAPLQGDVVSVEVY